VNHQLLTPEFPGLPSLSSSLCPSLANNKEKCMEYLDGENKQMELTVVADEFIATDSGREMGERILHGYYSR
jgi:hypothetical protein